MKSFVIRYIVRHLIYFLGILAVGLIASYRSSTGEFKFDEPAIGLMLLYASVIIIASSVTVYELATGKVRISPYFSMAGMYSMFFLPLIIAVFIPVGWYFSDTGNTLETMFEENVQSFTSDVMGAYVLVFLFGYFAIELILFSAEDKKQRAICFWSTFGGFVLSILGFPALKQLCLKLMETSPYDLFVCVILILCLTIVPLCLLWFIYWLIYNAFDKW